MARIFISFQEGKTRWAEWIDWHLREQGHDPYFYKWNSRVGEEISDRIETEIKNCDLFLPIFSEAYFESPECRRELRAADRRDMRTRRNTIRAVVVDRFELPDFYADKVHINLCDVRTPNEALRRLAQIDGEAGPPAMAPDFPVLTQDAPLPEPAGSGAAVDPTHPVYPNTVEMITPAFDDFINLLQVEESRSPVSRERYRAREQEIGREGERRARHSLLPLRVPNFLLFERAGLIVMAIVDARRSVNEHALQLTTEPQARARPIRPERFAALGFDTDFIHPMLYDERGAISRIFIDSALFFQFLYFPNSPVQVPCAGDPGYVITTASSFIRAMLKLHDTDKIHFASIAVRGWPDDILMEGLKGINCFTRFAPTPNSGLHLGHGRSSLIPYLMYRTDPQNNLFHLRFDDTNAGNQESKDQIVRELEWLGFRIEPDRIFSQTDPDRQRIYKAVFDLLRDADYTRRLPDGSWVLDAGHADLKFAHWMDMHKGPQILHGIPPAWYAAFGTHTELDLTITRPDGRFKYKFTGAVDDLLLSTHIFRDIRQQHLTARQAMIRYAIYRAWHARQETEQIRVAKKEIKDFWEAKVVLKESQSDSIRLKRPQALPFLAPPIYTHVANVLDEDGEILRTRVLLQRALESGETPILLAECQKKRVLPETVVSYLLGTVFPQKDPGDLIRLCAEHGATTALDLLGSDIDISRFLSVRKPIRLRHCWPLVQERKVIAAMSLPLFRSRIQSYCRSHDGDVPNIQILLRMYEHRREFGSWIEVLQLATWGRPAGREKKLMGHYLTTMKVLERNLEATASSKMFADMFREQFPIALGDEFEVASACRRVRKALFGMEAGPGVSAIGRMLGMREVERRGGL